CYAASPSPSSGTGSSRAISSTSEMWWTRGPAPWGTRPATAACSTWAAAAGSPSIRWPTRRWPASAGAGPTTPSATRSAGRANSATSRPTPRGPGRSWAGGRGRRSPTAWPRRHAGRHGRTARAGGRALRNEIRAGGPFGEVGVKLLFVTKLGGSARGIDSMRWRSGMKLLLVSKLDRSARAVSTIAKYVEVGKALVHEVAVYAYQTSEPP